MSEQEAISHECLADCNELDSIRQFHSFDFEQPRLASSRFGRGYLSRALGRIRTLAERPQFFRRPILDTEFVSSGQPDPNSFYVGIGLLNKGKTAALTLRGRTVVLLPRVENAQGVFTLLPNDRISTECDWLIPEAEANKITKKREYDLYPEPDRISTGFLNAVSTPTEFALVLFGGGTPVLPSQKSDLSFVYPDLGNMKSSHLVAVFWFWAGAVTQTDDYVHIRKDYAVAVPNFGKVGRCDMRKAKVVKLTSKNSRSELLALFQELNQATSSSAPPPASSPSPR